MKKFRKVLVILAVIAALSVGILTTAFASEATGDVTDTEPALTLDEKKAAIEADTPLSQYDLPVLINRLTWEEGTEETLSTSKGNVYGFYELIGSGYINDIQPESGADGDNGYFTIRYYKEEGEQEVANGVNIHTYPRFDLTKCDHSMSLVIEFDITTFDRLPKTGISFEHGSTTTTTSGERRYPGFFSFNSEGIMSTYDGRRSTESIIVNGEWNRITLVYNTETNFMDIYVNYELLFEGVDTRQAKDNYKISNFRFGTANGSSIGTSDSGHDNGEVSVDNFIIYQGSYIRTPDLFDNMSEHDKFIFYSDYMVNDGAATADRVFSYNTAKAMLANYCVDGEFVPVTDSEMDADALAALNAQLEASVGKYQEFEANAYAELYAGYISDNLDIFRAQTAELGKLTRTLDSISDRKKALTEVNSFLNTVGNDILKTEESDYKTVKAAYDDFAAKLANDEKIVTFCDLVDEFNRSLVFSTEAITKHYNKIAELVSGGIDRSVLDTEGYERYTEAYATYENGAEIVREKTYARNAQKIVECVDFIDEYITEEDWIANYEYINRYVVIIREEVRKNQFDPDHEGIVEALAFYNHVDEYFYGLLQEEHAGVLNKYLDDYVATDGYVEKVGICAYLRSYIAGADIQLDHEKVAPLILKLEIYESELEQYKSDYEQVLKQNTVIFANTIRILMTTTGYTERYALYLQARELYFAMNIGDESIAAELAEYDRVTAELSYIADTSAEFVLAVDMLRAATNADETFAALVLCYRYAVDAELSIDGVSSAMEYYLSQYDAYNASVNEANVSLASVSTVSVGSVRANCGSKEIVAVIVKKLCEE